MMTCYNKYIITTVVYDVYFTDTCIYVYIYIYIYISIHTYTYIYTYIYIYTYYARPVLVTVLQVAAGSTRAAQPAARARGTVKVGHTLTIPNLKASASFLFMHGHSGTSISSARHLNHFSQLPGSETLAPAGPAGPLPLLL